MNVSELARKLKVTTDDMLAKLPQLGFDIGRRAIKVDDRIAAKIVDSWKRQEKLDREKTRIAEIRGDVAVTPEAAVAPEITEVTIPNVITVREFASVLNLPVNKVLAELMKNGVLISMNERIDFDTASIIGEGLGFKIQESGAVAEDDRELRAQEKLKSILSDKSHVQARPPVIVVMGHVDHGKTKILDSIRKTDVVSGESGGITQHIGAYQVRKGERLLTFIDTPGHEAFTAMRSRGARVADIAILVVAADDGVQPQTKEAIKIIQDAGLAFVVAINKIDKPEANIEKVKQDLAQLNLLPEDWGGKVICVPVSAKTGDGIDDLLETVLLVADLEKDLLMADADRSAIGTIIESHVDRGEGPVATILIQAGTLKVGDVLGVENNFYGKVRSLRDHNGKNVENVLPGTPARILGLKIAPGVGSVMESLDDVSNLNRDVKKYKSSQDKDLSVRIQHHDESGDKFKFINLIIKGDVLGSVEAIIESLIKLETADIKIKIIGKGLGSITESDVLKAEATHAKVIGFHIKPSAAVSDLARDKKVEIKYYEVIYHLIEEIKGQMEGMKEREVVRKLAGKFQVIKIFRKESNNMIIGGRVIDGAIIPTNTVIVIHNNEPIATGKVKRIESARQVVERVPSGQECGINFEGHANIIEDDVLEFYQEQ